MFSKPTIKVRKAPNFPENIEVDIEWPGAYKTMLTFHIDDIENGNAQKIVDAHVGMIKRDIQHKEIEAEVDKLAMSVKLLKEETTAKVLNKHFGKVEHDK